MGLACLTEVLDDVDALGQFDGVGRDIGKFVVHLGGLGGHAPHRPPLQQGIDRESRQTEQTQPPIHYEGVDEQYHGDADRRGLLHRGVGDKCMHLDGVVLDGLTHLPGGRRTEPCQRCPGQAPDDATLQDTAQFEVSEMCDDNG